MRLGKNALMRRVGLELLNYVFTAAQLPATHHRTLRRTFGGRGAARPRSLARRIEEFLHHVCKDLPLAFNLGHVAA